uniref:Uncharacterized protein n=1 Tax=Arundo donax TaxID=35708 RepID=A0A0A9G0Y2_ARUDO
MLLLCFPSSQPASSCYDMNIFFFSTHRLQMYMSVHGRNLSNRFGCPKY